MNTHQVELISGTLASGLVELANKAGAPRAVTKPLTDALEASGPVPPSDAVVPAEAEWEFWERAAREDSLKELSASVEQIKEGTWGDIELAVSSAPDVRRALETLSSTSDLLHGAEVFHLVTKDDGSAALIYESPHTRAREPGALAAEVALAMAVELIRRLVGDKNAAPQAAWLAGRAQARISTLNAGMRCPVHVGAVHDRLDLSAQLLAEPVKTADARIHALALRVIDFQRRARAQQQTSYGVRRALVDVLLAGDPVVDGLASKLGLRPRALKARLAREETNLRELVDVSRRRAAEHLLLSGATPTATQERLGYSDLASFRRACRRWWGVGPQARRALLRASSPNR
jgi:AraC-like DNA-binding protein